MRRSEKVAASMQPGELVINTLGAFTVSLRGNLISNHSSQPDHSWELLMLLLCHRDRSMPAEVIENHLWSTDHNLPSTKNLKNLVYRLRKKFQALETEAAGSIILYELGCYSWNSKIPFALDTDEFTDSLKKACSLIKQKPDDAAELYEKCIDLYRGDFLPQFTAKKWVLSFRHYFKQQYLWAVFALIKHYHSSDRYDLIIKTCEKAFAGDIFDQEMHRLYLQALLEEGRTAQALSHYSYISQLIEHTYGSRPSKELQRLKKALQYRDDEISISELGVLLFDELSAGGPIICEADLFGFICRREKRLSVNNTEKLFIGKLTLTDQNFKQPASGILSEGMEEISALLRQELTPTAVMTRWNKFQYLYLASYENEEKAGKFLERLINTLKQRLAPNQLLLSGDTIIL